MLRTVFGGWVNGESCKEKRKMDIKILVAVHKPCTVPEGSVYVPVQAGRALHPAIGHIAGDDTGPNISAKKPELLRAYGAVLGLEKP